MSECNHRRGVFFKVGLLLGIIGGAALAFLYAPDKGKNTRQKVKHQYNKIKAKSTEYYQDLRDLKTQNMPIMKEKVRQTSVQVKSKVQDLSQRAKTEFGKAKNKIQDRLAEKELSDN